MGCVHVRGGTKVCQSVGNIIKRDIGVTAKMMNGNICFFKE